jgi:hypothetical protein
MPSQTLLFIDDHHILYRSGTERLSTPFQRHADNPLIASQEYPWEVALAWSSIYRNPDSGVYQLWYQAYSGDQLTERTHDCATCYAESEDGIHFRKPMMDQYLFQGTQPSNIILVGNGGHSYKYGNYVVVDQAGKDPDRRYKMAYFDFSGSGPEEKPGLHVAFSPDGIHWTKHPTAPVAPIAYGRGGLGSPVPFNDDHGEPWHQPLTMSDALDAMYDPVRDVYVIYGKMWIDGPGGGMFWKHGMGRIESPDFIRWSQPELVLSPDDDDLPHVEFHTAPVFYHAGCYFALMQILDRATGGGVINIELAVSRDGVQWQRPFRKQFVLERSDGNLFDSGSIFTNATPVILDDEIRFYYGAYSGGATSADNRGHVSGIGLATIPRDRFAGIRTRAVSDQPTLPEPLAHIGQVTLKPMDLSPYRILTLNAEASQGTIHVEILDASGYRIRGYSKDDAVGISGDDLQHAVQWKDHNLQDLPDGTYTIRIHMEKATVYALTLDR